MNFVQILKSQFGVNKPILFGEIKQAVTHVSEQRIYQLLRENVDTGHLAKFDAGIYYIPVQTFLGRSYLNSREIIHKKYLEADGEVIGFYSGWGLLNAIGGTTQVPNILEVVTNRESARVRKVGLGDNEIILRKPRIAVNAENVKILQVLELGTHFQITGDTEQAILRFAQNNKIKARDLLEYSAYYPAKVIKNLTGVIYGLA